MNDSMFEVGIQVSLETASKDHYLTHIVGWQPHSFIVLGAVFSNGRPAALQSKDRCTFRFLKDGVAYGFEAEITGLFFYPYPLLFIKYPASIEHVQVRQFTRIKANIPAQFMNAKGALLTEAMIVDICEGGCGVKLPNPDAFGLTQNTPCVISFSVLETRMKVSGFIKKVRSAANIHTLGVEFTSLTMHERERINEFLDILLNISSSNMDQTIARLKSAGGRLDGRLEDLSLPDILQILDQSRKEGIVQITSADETGTISFGNGLIMDATYGTLKGEDALIRMLSLHEGAFHYFAREVPQGGAIAKPLGMVLMDMFRLIDELSAVERYVPAPHEALHLQGQLDTKDADMQLIAMVIRGGARNLDEIQAVSGLSRTRTTLATAKMIRGGHLKKVAPPATAT